MSKALIDRYFCHYELLEEYKHGMWRRPNSEEFHEMVSSATLFMMDVGAFSEAMSQVCSDWANSCRVNFTTPSVNPVAWLGQAAVCSAIGVPESCVRMAWGRLPFDVQQKANACAKAHISEWIAGQVGQGDLFNV